MARDDSRLAASTTWPASLPTRRPSQKAVSFKSAPRGVYAKANWAKPGGAKLDNFPRF